MASFIKVHTIDNNATTIVNSAQIITVEKDEDREGTVIYCSNENVVRVFESPEKIFDMIMKK